MGVVMGEQELFNGLIATYRELNLKVRTLPEERLSLGQPGNTVRDVVLEMRDDELRFSQALKDRLSGVSLTGAFGDKGETQLIEIPSPDDTTVEVISQFGTARESTLAMLRGMAPEVWDDRDHGPATVREATEDLLASDGVHLEKIVALLGSPSAN
jgi:hypothetical protein